ncbi:MAG: hypothetical protein ACKVTZ_11685 [Bacteroidia bacterium]
MMYLVLTALLAMNVSAEILAAFDTIREKLSWSASNADASAGGTVKIIQTKVDEEIAQKQMTNAGIKDSVVQVREKTAAMLKAIDEMSAQLAALPGISDPKTKTVLNKSETEKNLQFFMGSGTAQEANGGRGSAKAKELRDKIDAYYAELLVFYAPSRKDSVLNNKIEDPAAGAEGGMKKTWERHNFEGPIAANFAMLEALKTDVLNKEAEVFREYARRLGLKQIIQEAKDPIVEQKKKIEEELKKKPEVEKIKPPEPPKPKEKEPEVKIDDIEAIVAPVSSVVVAGMPYKAQLFAGIIQKAENGKPTFKSSMGTVTPIAGGMGAEITIPSSLSGLPAGKNEVTMSYTVNVDLPTKKGVKSAQPKKMEFKIRKPDIVVTSASIQILYRQCANVVNIDVPALGDLYNPVCTVSGGGDISQNPESKKKFRIVPTGTKCVVNVATIANGQTVPIGTVEYKVIDPPKPTVLARLNGAPYSPQMGVGKGSKLNLSIKPDNEFFNALPLDAKYRFSTIEIYAQSGLGVPQKVGGADVSGKDATGNGIDIPIPSDALRQPGAKVYIEFKELNRINFKGTTVADNRFTPNEKAIVLISK